jgi:hypothetical protein
MTHTAFRYSPWKLWALGCHYTLNKESTTTYLEVECPSSAQGWKPHRKLRGYEIGFWSGGAGREGSRQALQIRGRRIWSTYLAQY